MRLSKGKKAGIVIALTVVLLVVDQVTKILVKTNMHLGESERGHGFRNVLWR